MKTTKAKKTRLATRKAIKKFCKPKKPKIGFVKVGNTNIRHGTSASEKVWLDKLLVPERSKVIYGFRGKILIVDGYNPKTKTVYEYNGERFHGSHRVFPNKRDIPDSWLKKTPNQLYNGTIERYNFLHSLGFKVFFVWEFDFKKGSLGRYYRGPGDNLY